MNTTHFVIMNNMNTTNMINQMNMLHMMNHHNTTETVSNVTLTGWDVVIVVLGFILLLWGGIKVTEWLFDKTYKMKEPWDTIVFIVGMFGYVLIGGFVICLLVCI
jgi:hypothetical protein